MAATFHPITPLPGTGPAPLLPGGCRLRQTRDLRVPGSRRLCLRDPLADQRGLAGADRALTDPPRRATAELCPGLSFQLQLPGGNLEQASPGRGQGRVASWRAVPARRLHRHQPVATDCAGNEVL